MLLPSVTQRGRVRTPDPGGVERMETLWKSFFGIRTPVSESAGLYATECDVESVDPVLDFHEDEWE